MDTIVSVKPLLALLAALAGTIMLMFAGRKPNIREGFSFVAAVTMFGIIASMIPTIKEGKKSVTIKVEGMTSTRGTASGGLADEPKGRASALKWMARQVKDAADASGAVPE